MIATGTDIDEVDLHVLVDTCGSYARGCRRVAEQPEAAVAVLHNDVLPFAAEIDRPATAVRADAGRASCGTDRHPHSSTALSTTPSTERPASVH